MNASEVNHNNFQLQNNEIMETSVKHPPFKNLLEYIIFEVEIGSEDSLNRAVTILSKRSIQLPFLLELLDFRKNHDRSIRDEEFSSQFNLKQQSAIQALQKMSSQSDESGG